MHVSVMLVSHKLMDFSILNRPGAHYPESATSTLGLSHGFFRDRFIFRQVPDYVSSVCIRNIIYIGKQKMAASC